MKMNSGNYLNYRYDALQRVTDKYIERDVNVDRQIWERFHYTDSHVSKKEVWIGNTYTHQLSYTYDSNGNITSVSDDISDTSVTYTYDKANQLTKAVHSDGRTEVYTYDNAGNILTFNNGSGVHTYTYGDSDWGDLLTKYDGQTITYDGIGNPLSYYNGYRYTFTWEHGRQLASVTYLGNTTTYEYDQDGIRTKKTRADGRTTVYDIVDGKAVGETRYTASGAKELYIRYIFDEAGSVNGIGLWYPGDTKWTDYYFAKNLQGDVLEVYDSAHNCVASYSYDSWGNILSKSGSLADINPFRYRTYYYDSDTELYYLQSRYYDPQVGRFINADAFTSTGQGVLGNNMFAYCNNNPVMGMDPYGNSPEWWQWALSGAMVLAGVAMVATGVGGVAGGALICAGANSIIGSYTSEAAGGSSIAGWAGGMVTGAISGSGAGIAGEMLIGATNTVNAACIGNLAAGGMVAFGSGALGSAAGQCVTASIDDTQLAPQAVVESSLTNGAVNCFSGLGAGMGNAIQSMPLISTTTTFLANSLTAAWSVTVEAVCDFWGTVTGFFS